MQGTHQNLHNICKPDISQLKRIIRRIQLIQEQVTYHDKVFKIGVDVFWTNRHDLIYGAKKKLQWTHENWQNIRNAWKFSFLRPQEHFPTFLLRYVMIANILHI